jgi:hypothetical protein
MAEIAEALRYYAKIMNERVRKNLEACTALCEHRAGKISSNTGGCCRARQRIPVGRVEELVDELNDSLHESRLTGVLKHNDVYVVDGSTLRVCHTEALLNEYSQKKNQHGSAHFPILRLGVITNVATGVTARPAIGPYNGSKAVGELSLLPELLERIPRGSTVIGDRYYGNARTVHEAQTYGHSVIVRVKEGDAKRYIGTPKSSSGELLADWHSHRSKTGNEYRVRGRFIWHTMKRQGFRPERLVLFTTSERSLKDVVKLYALRWNVELDLRSLKSTLRLEMLQSKSPEMVAKEIYLGFAAYNLVRHVGVAVANALKVSPREISLAGILSRINAIAPQVLSSAAEHDDLRLFACLLLQPQALVIPKRSKRRPSEPRKTLQKGQTTFMTKSRAEERLLLNPDLDLRVK